MTAKSKIAATAKRQGGLDGYDPESFRAVLMLIFDEAVINDRTP